MDIIKIKNLEVFAYHGLLPAENELGQKFLIDIDLGVDLKKVGKSDSMHDSINYSEVSHLVTEYMQKHTFKLIETVAEHIADMLLRQYPLLLEVGIELKKPWAPIGLPVEAVSVCIRRKWHRVWLSTGSNMGEREAFIRQGAAALTDHPDMRKVELSPLLETAPYGKTDQNAFLNAIITLETLQSPHELLETLHQIEADAGRQRLVHWGPRTLDLDILFFDDLILSDPDLIIPHPDLENRYFVLKPLADLCPGLVHPVLHKTAIRMLKELGPQDA